MSNEVTDCIEFSTETLRWIAGGIFFVFIGIVKLEFRRLWKAIDNSQNTPQNVALKCRVESLEESRTQRIERDRELFALINDMNQKLHKHIESAVSGRDMTQTQTLRKVIREEFAKNK